MVQTFNKFYIRQHISSVKVTQVHRKTIDRVHSDLELYRIFSSQNFEQLPIVYLYTLLS